MNYYLVLESVPFIFTSLIVTYMLIYLLLRYPRTKTNMLYLLLLCALFLWSSAYSFEICATSVEDMLFWIKIKFIAILSVPIVFLLFSLSLTDSLDIVLEKKYLLLLIIPPTFNYLTLLTNDFHQLFFKFVMNDKAPFSSLTYIQGPFFFLSTFFSYLYLVTALIDLFISYRKKDNNNNTKQFFIITTGVLVTAISNIFFILKLLPFSYYLDTTPIAFLLANAIFFIGIHELNLLGLNLTHLKVSKFRFFGFVITDTDNRIIEINTKALEYLLDNPEEKPSIGTNLYRLLYKQENLKPYYDKIAKIKESLQDLIEEPEKSQTFELELLHPLSPRKEYITVIVETLVIKQKILGFMYTINDITDTKTMKYLLTKNSELKSNLLRIISHDLKNKIMVIQGYTEIIKEYYQDDKQRNEILESIQAIEDKIHESSVIITDVSNYLNTIERFGVEEYNLEFLDLIDIIKFSFQSFSDDIKKKSIQIIKHIPYSEVKVLADTRIFSVFRNILENAIKNSPVGGTIELKITKNETDRYWQISFLDEGPGIKEELLDDIFKPFTSFGPQHGSGLGLSIALEIIESLKGTIWAENRTDRTGAIISFVLPLVNDSHLD